MNAADLPGSGLTDAGSRIRWRLLLVGEQAALQQFQQQLTLEPNQRWQSLEDSSEAVASPAGQGAPAIWGWRPCWQWCWPAWRWPISAQRYAMRHYDISALMRTFGFGPAQGIPYLCFPVAAAGRAGHGGGVAAGVGLAGLVYWRFWGSGARSVA